MATEQKFADELRNLPVLLASALLSVAKRVGLGKQAVGLAMGNMFSDKRNAQAFAGHALDAHDVVVATFAKSGTNWMMQIAQQIAYRGAAEFEHIHDIVPWPDAPFHALGDLNDRSQVDASPTGLRVIKTHLEPDHVPYSEAATYLTVLRDPKEVLVSSYYFLGGIMGVLRHVSIDQWFELCMQPGGLMQRWAVHTAGYWAWRDRPNVLVLNYREIIKEPVGSITEVARTMGVELTPAQLDAVVERASFAYMSAHESQFAPPRFPLTQEADRPKMVRRGKAGSSDELLSREHQTEIDQACRRELQRLGSDFPYETAFDLATPAAPAR